MASRERVYKRIANAIRAKDSLSLNQLEKMLKQLPSCIFLKDTEGKYVFSTQIWHHLDTEGDPNWTIRSKTDLEIRKDFFIPSSFLIPHSSFLIIPIYRAVLDKSEFKPPSQNPQPEKNLQNCTEPAVFS